MRFNLFSYSQWTVIGVNGQNGKLAHKAVVVAANFEIEPVLVHIMTEKNVMAVIMKHRIVIHQIAQVSK